MNQTLVDQISNSKSFIAALSLINTARRNGVLHASSDKLSATIHIANGLIVAVEASDGTQGNDALASLLANTAVLRLYFDDGATPAGFLQIRLAEFLEASAAKLGLDTLFQQFADEDNKREFLLANPQLLQCNESTLNAEQRAMLAQMRELRDSDAFATSNPQLAPQQDLAIEIERAKILGATKMDYKPFDTPPTQPVAAEESALSPQQRAQLELNSVFADKESFLAESGIEKDEPALDESVRWQLEETASQLTPEQQKAQFEAGSEEFRKLAELKDFVPPPPSSETPSAVPVKDPIKDAAPLSSDYKPLVDDHERPRAVRALSDQESIIDREPTATGEIGTFKREQPRFRIDWAQIAGPTVLVGMCVALVTLPAYVRSTFKGDNALSEKQTHAAIASELEDEIPYAVDTTPQKPFQMGGGSSGPFPASATSGATKEDETLAAARGLASSAQGEKAAEVLEQTISANPQNVQARLEIIRLYLSLGKKAKARQHAIAGLHMRATVEQRNEFARLFEEAQK